MRPKKQLGQNFLISPGIAEKIVRSAGVEKKSHVLEIGPGKGALTWKLLQRGARLTAVEKDRGLCQFLKEQIEMRAVSATLIEADALDFDPSGHFLPEERGSNMVVANLPYNVATEILFRLIDYRHLFSKLVLMIQKEVAARLIAKPGNKDYGILSILTQIFSESYILFSVPPTAFFPQPKVTSAIVAMTLSETPRHEVQDLDLFRKVVRAAFNQRRKMIGNALKAQFKEVDWPKILQECQIDPQARAETLALEKFAHLSNRLSGSL